MSFGKMIARLDKIGMTASTACAIHCALMPIAIAFLPLMGLTFLSDKWVEFSMLGFSLLVGVASLSTSYFKIHHNFKPLICFLMGFVLIIWGHFANNEVIEFIFLPIGGMLFVFAHYLNHKKCACHNL